MMKHRSSRRRRDVNGILLLDKSPGLTSNAALQQAKRLFEARKAGHTGSLDPLATGLLPICFGEATKLSGYLLDADKRYEAVICLGIRTDTGDSEGAEIARGDTSGIDRVRIEAAVADLRGELEQVPPMHSAIKRQGVPLYRLARQGIEVERAARRVTVYRFEVLDIDGDRVRVEIDCSKGTYIRVLADDLGEALGCGAHIGELRRTGVGPLNASQMVTLEALASLAEQEGAPALDACLLPMESALADRPAVHLPKDSAYFLVRGQPVFVPQAPSEGLVRIHAPGDRFLGVGEILEDGRVAPRRLLSQ